jgi:hypothetical protein
MEDPIVALIATPLYSQAASWLREHRCVIQTITRSGYLMASVRFPLGTEQETATSGGEGVTYRLRLPDRLVVIQIYDHGTGCSKLLLPAQEDWEERR